MATKKTVSKVAKKSTSKTPARNIAPRKIASRKTSKVELAEKLVPFEPNEVATPAPVPTAEPAQVASAPSGAPTTEQIAAEIAELERMAPLLNIDPRFHDDNLAAIKAASTALAENLSHDAIAQRWPLPREGEDRNEGARIMATAAQEWRLKGGPRPSSDWLPLVKGHDGKKA